MLQIVCNKAKAVVSFILGDSPAFVLSVTSRTGRLNDLFEMETGRISRNVGTENTYAGESRKGKNTTFTSRRQFEVKKAKSVGNCTAGNCA